MQRLIAKLAPAVALIALLPTSARADVTAFLGLSPTGGTRLGQGVAAGAGLVIVAFEIEAARLVESTDDAAPSLSTGMANVLVQTPIDVSSMQFYATVGAGAYRETLSATRETALATNLGGGAKIRLAGPFKLRLDYRLFRLQGSPVHATYHRVYAGATLGF
jgi:hypothetical protein